jgi:hypothetical protein
LGQKIKDTLAFNQSSDVAQNLHLQAFEALKQRSFYLHQSSGTSIQSKQTSITKNNAPIKKETLKECTKEWDRLDGSQKNTKCAGKGKAWLTLKRWSRRIEQ